MITVLENDDFDISKSLKTFLKNEKYDVWLNFKNTLSDKEEYLKLFAEISSHIIYTNPSFVGYDNTFLSYILLFTELKNNNIRLTVNVLYESDDEDFEAFIHKYLENCGNQSKTNVITDMLKAILEYHSINSLTENTIKKIIL